MEINQIIDRVVPILESFKSKLDNENTEYENIKKD